MEFTITSVQDNPRMWQSSKGGPMLSYKINVEDDQKFATPFVEWARKESSPAPIVGQKIEGSLELTDYGHKFKAAQSPNGFGGSRPEDPKKAAAIGRMHDQDMSLRTVEIASKLGLVAPTTTAELFELIARTADWYGRDTTRAREAA